MDIGMEISRGGQHDDDRSLMATSVNVDIRWDAVEAHLAEIMITMKVDAKPSHRLNVLRIADASEESISLVSCIATSSEEVNSERRLEEQITESSSTGPPHRRRQAEEKHTSATQELGHVFEELITGLEDLQSTPSAGQLEIQTMNSSRDARLAASHSDSADEDDQLDIRPLTPDTPADEEPSHALLPELGSPFDPEKRKGEASVCQQSEIPELPQAIPSSAELGEGTTSPHRRQAASPFKTLPATPPKSRPGPPSISPRKTYSLPRTPLTSSPFNIKTPSTRGSWKGRTPESGSNSGSSNNTRIKIPWQSVSREDVREYERQSPTKRHSPIRDRSKSPTKSLPSRSSPRRATIPWGGIEKDRGEVLDAGRAKENKPDLGAFQQQKLNIVQGGAKAASLIPRLSTPSDSCASQAVQSHDDVQKDLSISSQERGKPPPDQLASRPLETVSNSAHSADLDDNDSYAAEHQKSAYMPVPPIQRREVSACSSAFDEMPRDPSLLSPARLFNHGQGLRKLPSVEQELDTLDEDLTPLFINSQGLAFVYFPSEFKEAEYELVYKARLKVSKPELGQWREFDFTGLPKTIDDEVGVTVLIVYPQGEFLTIEYDATNCFVDDSQLQLRGSGLHGRFANIDPLRVFFRQEQWSVLLESVDIEVIVLCNFSLNEESSMLQVDYNAFIQLLGRNTDIFAKEAVIELKMLNCPPNKDAITLVNGTLGRSMILQDWNAADKSWEVVLSSTSADLTEPFEICMTVKQVDPATSYFQLPVIVPKSAASRLVSEKLLICEPELPIQVDFSTQQLFRGWQHQRRRDGTLLVHEFSRRTLSTVRPTGLLLQVGVAQPSPSNIQGRASFPNLAQYILRGRKTGGRLVSLECELHVESHSREELLLAHVSIPKGRDSVWQLSNAIINGRTAVPGQMDYNAETGELSVLARPNGTSTEQGTRPSLSLFLWISLIDRDPVFLPGLGQHPRLGLQIELPCLKEESWRRYRSSFLTDLDAAVLHCWSWDDASATREQGGDVAREEQLIELSDGETVAIDGSYNCMTLLVQDYEVDSLESTVLESYSPSCRSTVDTVGSMDTLNCYEDESMGLGLNFELSAALAAYQKLGADEDGTLDLVLPMGNEEGAELEKGGNEPEVPDESEKHADEENRMRNEETVKEKVVSNEMGRQASLPPSPKLCMDPITSTAFTVPDVPQTLQMLSKEAEEGLHTSEGEQVAGEESDTELEHRKINFDGMLNGVLVFWSLLAAFYLCLLLVASMGTSSGGVSLDDYLLYQAHTPSASLPSSINPLLPSSSPTSVIQAIGGASPYPSLPSPFEAQSESSLPLSSISSPNMAMEVEEEVSEGTLQSIQNYELPFFPEKLSEAISGLVDFARSEMVVETEGDERSDGSARSTNSEDVDTEAHVYSSLELSASPLAAIEVGEQQSQDEERAPGLAKLFGIVLWL